VSVAAAPLRSDRPRGRWKGRIFKGFLVFSLLVGFVTLGALLAQVFFDGYKWVDLVLFLEPPSSDPLIAGAEPAILATIYLGVLLLLFTVPLGVGTAIYLEEYANRDRWYNRLLEINIQNLAAVPSIVYGILGLAFLVRGIGLGRVLLAGAMILTLLVLPTVIIAGDRDRLHPGALPRARRNGTAAAGRGPHVRVLQPDDHGRVHRPARPDLPVGRSAAAGLQGAGGFRDHRPARDSVDAERVRDLAPQPLREKVVT
jgi:ABC-type phosphate transport system permease subunit